MVTKRLGKQSFKIDTQKGVKEENIQTNLERKREREREREDGKKKKQTRKINIKKEL